MGTSCTIKFPCVAVQWFIWPCIANKTELNRASSPYRLNQRRDAHNTDHSPEIISKNMQAHLRSDILEPPHKKMRRSHPGFQRPKRVLHRTRSHRHRISRVTQLPLHDIQQNFVFPAPYPALPTCSALWFQFAIPAHRYR